MVQRVFIVASFLIGLYPSFALHAKPITPHLLTLFFEPTKTQTNLHLAPSVSGIYATYRGMISASDVNGMINFPLEEPTNPVTIVITQAIKPIIVFGNTVHHWTTDATFPSTWYSYQYQETEHGLRWDVIKIEASREQKLPQEALVVVADPNKITVPLTAGPKTTPPAHPASRNIQLPPFSVDDTMNRSINALQFLKIAKFFTPILAHQVWSYASDRYTTVITH